MAKPNDLVLIYLEDAPVSFARIESILPDHKKDWFQIKLLMLQIPLQVVVWILKDDYINGTEFQMNQKRMRLEKVVCPVEELPLSSKMNDSPAPENSETQDPEPEKDSPSRDASPDENGRVISFSDFQKKQE
ncbi:hypothetical protein [Desulfospira joergensenii]|uniref:hypothetical protein n=1 Tax=Desulfospira joergensenii TaxID=53329 RepID=UPI0003B485A0|nr:hypothetical protein [Desulfospira joergensenii]